LEAGYLGAAMPRMSASPVTVAYSRFGSRQEATLEPGDSLAMRLAPDEADALALEVTQGNAIVNVSVLTPLDPATVVPDPDVQVERRYALQLPYRPEVTATATPGADTTEFADGDLVRVTLEYDLAEGAAVGCYQLSDLLPSGLAPVTAVSQPDAAYYEGIDDPNVVFPYEVDGQRVSFCVFRDGKQVPITYLARVVTKGVYTAEPVLLQSLEVPSSRALTDAFEIAIR
jgi:uncharacterized protein YfaS (alpha-2-macroglobulin family)